MARIRCPMCQSSIDEGSVFCTFCGHVLDPKRAALDDAEQARRAEELMRRGGRAGAAAGAIRGGARPFGGASQVQTLTSGNLLSETLSVYAENFVSFSIICGMLMIPVAATFWWSMSVIRDQRNSEVMWLLALPILLALLLSQVASAAVTYGVVQHIRGKPASIGDCITVGLSRMASVIGVALATGISVLIGYVLLCIPGVVISIILSVAVPVAVIEKAGVGDALNRSASLTSGYRWQIFGVLFCIGVINWIIGKATGMLSTTLGQGDFVIPVVSIVTWLEYTISTGLQATSASLIYYRLRSIKESVDVEELAAVFD